MTTTRSYMDYACTFASADLFPGHYNMLNIFFGRQIIEWTLIMPAKHIRAFERLNNAIITFVTSLEGLQDREQGFGKIVKIAVCLGFDIGKVRMYSCRNVRCKCPWSCRPG